MARADTIQARAERGARERSARDSGLHAATLVSDCLPGVPARFTLDLGDGTVCRGPWDCSTPPVAGDKVAVIVLDDATMWVVAGWAT